MLPLKNLSQPETHQGSKLTRDHAVSLERLLEESSRTFALTIPLLPLELRGPVQLSYLLLRAADTIEDATHVVVSDRVSLLSRLRSVLLEASDPEVLISECRVFAGQLSPSGGQSVLVHLELLTRALEAEPPARASMIRKHCGRVIHRMANWLTFGTKDGALKLSDFGELSDYMYSVAGIVGELLTDLFVLHNPKCSSLALMARAPDFGAALQLTNIIKDAAEDDREGRRFLPEDWFFVEEDSGRARLEGLVQLARIRLKTATDYTCQIPIEEQGIRLFCLAPVVLALGTLKVLVERCDECVAGKSVKIDRATLASLLIQAKGAIDNNQAVQELHMQLDQSIDAACQSEAT